MKRFSLTCAVLAAAIVAGGGAAQAYQPLPSSPTGYDAGAPWPGTLSDTARHGVLASPSCGAANPQGGIPSAVTWGDCP